MRNERKENGQQITDTVSRKTLEYPSLFNGKQINDVMFCATFLKRHPMRCVNGILYDVDGQVNRDALHNELYEAVSPYLSSSVAKCIDSLVAAIRISTFTEELSIQTDRIHLNNGTYRFLTAKTKEKPQKTRK